MLTDPLTWSGGGRCEEGGRDSDGPGHGREIDRAEPHKNSLGQAECTMLLACKSALSGDICHGEAQTMSRSLIQIQDKTY